MTGPAILCCGEAVLDLVPAALADGASGFRPVPGGAALNTACALARLGVAAGFLGGLSRDPTGGILRDRLHTEGVDTGFAALSDRPSTVALAHPLPGGTRFDLYDEATAGRLFSTDDLPGALPDTVRALVFGGISLIHPPAAQAFETLAAREAGARLIWLDLNIRPGLVADERAYRARLGRMMRRADAIKVSDEDLDWLGRDAAAIRRDVPAALVIRTMGADGAEAWTSGLHVRADAPKVAVSDTVGAGDTFNAGFLARLHRAGGLRTPLELDGDTLSRALSDGVRAASISVTRPGADPPTWKEMTCEP